MINSLSQEQQFKIKEYYDIYLSKGLSTIPSNKPIVEKAIKRMYKFMKEKEPQIVWVKSPTEFIELVKHSSLRSSLYSSLYSSLRSSLDLSLYSSLRSSLDLSLYSSLDLSLYSSLRSSLYSSLRSSLDSSLRSSLDLSLYSSLDLSLRSSLDLSLLLWGQANASWICFFKYCDDVLGIKYEEKDVEKLNLWVDMMECPYFFVFKTLVILMEHPKEIHLDNNGNTHNVSDYAIKFYDDTGIYVIHGEVFNFLDIPQLLIEKKITNLEYLEVKSKEKENVLN